MKSIFNKRSYYIVPKDQVYDFLSITRINRIPIAHLKKVSDNEYGFYINYPYDYQIQKMIPYVKFQYAIGVFHYISLYLFQKHRIIGLLMGVFLFYFMSQLNYGCIIYADDHSIYDQVYAYCENLHLMSVSKLNNIDEIEKQLQSHFIDEIDYLDLIKEGKLLKLTYTKRAISKPKEKNYSSYIAKYDGVIDYIDVKNGNVIVQSGQYVNKGDQLVLNQIINTSQENVFLEVEGKIYAYVHHVFEASVQAKDTPETFVLLYNQILDKAEKELIDGGYIENENVLQYGLKEGKIVLKIQFILYQNIAQREFVNG